MMRSERGGIVTGWLFRIVFGLALTGVALFEAGSVIFSTVQADNAARTAAQEAVATYARAHDVEAARADADREAAREGAVVVSFSADSEGVGGQSRVTVVVERPAKTLIINHIGPLKRFTHPRASSTAYSV
jgi:hypothetical protein